MGAGAEIKYPGPPVTGQRLQPINLLLHPHPCTWMLKALVNGTGQSWGRSPSATERSFLCLRMKFLSLKEKGYWGIDAEIVDDLLKVSRDC